MTTYSGAAGIAPAGVMATGALGDAPAPTAPPMGGGITQVLRYKVLDPVTGAVLVDDLPHLHQSKWDVVGFQEGAAGRSSIGQWSAELFPPGSDGYKNAKAFYDLLDYGQRIEPYRGDILAGDPWPQAGIIKAITKSAGSNAKFTIGGDVSVGLLNLARTGLNEVFSGTTDALVKYAIKAFDLTMGDDFASGLAAFTNDGTWVVTTDLGGTAIAPGATGDGLLYTTTSYANSKYADCSIEMPFRLVCDPSPGSNAEVGIVAAFTDTNNFILGDLNFRYVAAGQYAVDLYIYQKSGGVYTSSATGSKTGAFTVPSNTLPGHLELRGYQASLNTYLWRLWLNGRDVGCFWIQNVAAAAPSGPVGIRSLKTSSRANEQVYIAGAPFGLIFWSKNNWFQEGRISTGARSVNQAIPDTPNIDLLQLAASTEGGEYRINAKAGLNQDTIDYGLTVGSDFSAMIRFDATNIIEWSIEPNAEDFGTVIQSPAAPMLGGGGLGRMATIAAIKSKGNRTLQTPGSRISDLLAHRFFMQGMNNLSNNAGHAMRIKVKRDEWADRVRELDWVEIHVPEAGKNHARMKVVGYVFNEGAGELEFILDQYPRRTDRVPKFDRLLASVDFLMSQAGGAVTATDPSKPGAMVRDSRAVLPVNLWRMRVWLSSAENYPASTDTLVNFDTVTRDNSNGFSTSAHSYTVPLPGTWLVSATIGYNVPAIANANQLCQVWVYINGAVAAKGPVTPFFQGPVGSGQPMSAFVADSIDLATNDVVAIHLVTGALGGTATAITGTVETYWSMELQNG